jgi:hypothetical protein
MTRWVYLDSEWLKPIYREIKAQMMSGPYIQVDETPIKYLDPGNGKTALGNLGVEQGFWRDAYAKVTGTSRKRTVLNLPLALLTLQSY